MVRDHQYSNQTAVAPERIIEIKKITTPNEFAKFLEIVEVVSSTFSPSREAGTPGYRL
jgi:hypothetical protein